MITLYFAPYTRSERVLWTLEELNLAYTIVPIDIQKQEHKQPAYLSINPCGFVPAIQDNEMMMDESVAICAYLEDRYGSHQFSPIPNESLRGTYYRLLFSLPITIEPPFVKLLQEKMKNNDIDYLRDFPNEYQLIAENNKSISHQLGNNEYLLGDKFTIADINIGACLLYAEKLNMLFEPTENLLEYLHRIQQRKAYTKMRAIEQQYV